MLTEAQRHILRHQPVGSKKSSRGWVYIRSRIRADEFAALIALAEKAGTYPGVGRNPRQVKIGTLIRAIGRGYIGIFDPKTGKSLKVDELPGVVKATDRKVTERFRPAGPKEQWPSELDSED